MLSLPIINKSLRKASLIEAQTCILDWPHKADHFMRWQRGIACKQVNEVLGERQDALCFYVGQAPDRWERLKPRIQSASMERANFSSIQLEEDAIQWQLI